MSSPPPGINDYVRRKFGPKHPNARRTYALGDVNTTLIKTERGLTVTLYYDTDVPRPYDPILRVEGTNGIYSGTLDKIYIDGRSPTKSDAPLWEDLDRYYAEYELPLRRKFGVPGRRYPHGPADYIQLLQFVNAVRRDAAPPIDVYDAATWSVIIPLTEQSVASRSAAIDFPDFTRGKWKTTKPLELEA
jgi:hypothetical protein